MKYSEEYRVSHAPRCFNCVIVHIVTGQLVKSSLQLLPFLYATEQGESNRCTLRICLAGGAWTLRKDKRDFVVLSDALPCSQT